MASNPMKLHARQARLTAAALLAAALAACGGGGGGNPAAAPAPAANALVPAQTGDLVAYFKSRLLQRATLGLPGGSLVAAPAMPTSGLQYAGTPLQEQGVDEDDLLKTDGKMLYALHPAYRGDTETVPARLTASRREPDGSLSSPVTSTLNPDFTPRGMYLAGPARKVAVLSQGSAADVVIAATATAPATTVYPPVAPKLSLDLFDLVDNGRPSQTSRIEIEGYMAGSRMIGNVLYVVSTWTPDVSAYQLPANPTPAQAEAVLANLRAGDLLPRIRVDGAALQPLVSESDCLLQPANASPGLQLTTITAFELSTPGAQRSSRCFVGGVDALYVSPNNIYLASSRQYWVSDTATMVYPGNARTDIHKFALQGLAVDYRGSGDVAGHLGWDQEKKPYRMSEYQGDLRVLSYTAEAGWVGFPTLNFAPQKPGSPATVTVLRDSTAERTLKPLATLPNTQRPAFLGHEGEQIYAVNFAGPRAYLVTFRRTDPLYVLDLSNPADPRVLGEMAITGYSDYLFPLSGDKLLGVGREASSQGRVEGLKVALIDVADPTKPRVLGNRSLGESGTQSALDYTRHGINILDMGDKIKVALPVRVSETVDGKLRPAWQGLMRYEANIPAGTLVERAVVATPFDGTAADTARFARYDLAKERSIQTPTGVYYLTGGEVRYVPTP